MSINNPDDNLDQTPELTEALEAFGEDLDGAIEMVEMMKASMPLQGMESFDQLEGNIDEMMKALYEKFGVNAYTEPEKTYYTEGTPGSSGEGQIKVELIETNQEGVYLRRCEYADGDVNWTVGPLELNEGDM